LLAQDDLHVFISPCPLGDENETNDLSKCVNWPFRVGIYEGADGPLETAPDPQHNTTDHSSSFGSHTFTEGFHYYSNSPFCRPVVSFTRDTVNNEKIRELYGELAAHSYVLHNGSCSSGLWEAMYGTVNANNGFYLLI
jgi:hypothetical protein